MKNNEVGKRLTSIDAILKNKKDRDLFFSLSLSTLMLINQQVLRVYDAWDSRYKLMKMSNWIPSRSILERTVYGRCLLIMSRQAGKVLLSHTPP